ncbi:MAG: YbaN family protein [Desulfopila sp.]
MAGKSKNRLVRWALITAGCVSLGAAVVGIFLPVLPTVPLVLLAAACFGRSSDTFHRRLLNHPRLGPIIREFSDGQGIPRQAKIKALSLLWLSLVGSIVVFTTPFWVKLLLAAIGIAVSIYLLRLPTRVAA